MVHLDRVMLRNEEDPALNICSHGGQRKCFIVGKPHRIVLYKCNDRWSSDSWAMVYLSMSEFGFILFI